MLNQMAVGTATIINWGITQIGSKIKKRSVFAKFPTFGITLISGVLVTALFWYFGLLKIANIKDFVYYYLLTVFTSAGMHSGISNLTKPSEYVSTKIKDFKLLSDFAHDSSTIIINGESFERFLAPSSEVFYFAKEIGLTYNVDIVSVRDILLRLYNTLTPKVVGQLKEDVMVLDIPRKPSQLIRDKFKDINNFEYTIFEHALLTIVFGTARVRLVFSHNTYFNIVYYGSQWRNIHTLEIYKKNSEDTIVSIYGILIGRKYQFNIPNITIYNKNDIKNMISEIKKLFDK